MNDSTNTYLISCSPRECKDLLNGDLSVLVRKTRFKGELPATFYVYCTKDNKNFLYHDSEKGFNWFISPNSKMRIDFRYAKGLSGFFNGKVVAKFTLNKIEEIKVIDDIDEYNSDFDYYYETESLASEGCIDFTKKSLEGLSRLDFEELDNYLQGKDGYAWHITKSEVLDEPKELLDFAYANENLNKCDKCPYHVYENTPSCYEDFCNFERNGQSYCPIRKAPAIYYEIME